MNANPDNHWDSRFGLWTTDPYHGLEVGPKRPWLDLKDPTKCMFKYHRDPTVNLHKEKTGFRGL